MAPCYTALRTPARTLLTRSACSAAPCLANTRDYGVSHLGPFTTSQFIATSGYTIAPVIARPPMASLTQYWAVEHSTTGFTFQYASASISWGSKKQTSVALFSCEAEIMAASEAAKEAVYLREFLRELGFGGKKPMRLYCDNQGAIDLAYNPEHHQKRRSTSTVATSTCANS